MSQAAPDRYPDYHFLFIAPNLGVEWFFDAARLYWDRFRPTVIVAFDILAYLPPGAAVIVTTLALRDYAPLAGVDLARFRPDAYFDPVVEETLAEAQAVLDGRARNGQPFGVAIQEATLTPPPLDVAIPTPAIPLSDRGFTTYTPTPTPTPTGTSTPDPAVPTSAPIVPTPGSIIGGG